MTAERPTLLLPDPFAARLIGECTAIRHVREMVRRAAPLGVPVLIEGETGTGKEIVAQLLHDFSGRTGRLVAVNVAEMRPDIAEAELFGTVRGAFTDAGDRAGYFEVADRGTLLFDEAADLPRSLQARLLRVLETGTFSRVGETRARTASFRLIITVQESPGRLVADGRWRPDFLHRVARLHVTLPQLAARGDDRLLLTNVFLKAAGQATLELGAQEELGRHSWPGNVRELAHAVERACFAANGRRISGTDIVSAAKALIGTAASGGADTVIVPMVGAPPAGAGRREAIRLAERAHLEAVLREHGYRVRAAAVALGMSRANLYRRLRALGIESPVRRGRLFSVVS